MLNLTTKDIQLINEFLDMHPTITSFIVAKEEDKLVIIHENKHAKYPSSIKYWINK